MNRPFYGTQRPDGETRRRGPSGALRTTRLGPTGTSTTAGRTVQSLGLVELAVKKRLIAELLHIAEETRDFQPPYIPSRYLQDVANSDPAELVYKYVLAKQPTSGFERLWQERRLDLSVENVAWKFRSHFPASVGKAARDRLRPMGFDVLKQKHL